MRCQSLYPLTHSQVSYTASGMQFQDRERFPRLYTLQPLVFSYNEAYVHLITSYGWKKVAVIYEVNPLFSAVRLVAREDGLNDACIVCKRTCGRYAGWHREGLCVKVVCGLCLADGVTKH